MSRFVDSKRLKSNEVICKYLSSDCNFLMRIGQGYSFKWHPTRISGFDGSSLWCRNQSTRNVGARSYGFLFHYRLHYGVDIGPTCWLGSDRGWNPKEIVSLTEFVRKTSEPYPMHP